MAKNNKELHRCGDCEKVTPVTSPHHLLNIKGEPTLGTCPYWTESRCCLLSWPHECNHFEEKVVAL